MEPELPPPPSSAESIYEWGQKIDQYVSFIGGCVCVCFEVWISQVCKLSFVGKPRYVPLGKAPVSDKVYNAVDHDCRFCGNSLAGMNHIEADKHLRVRSAMSLSYIHIYIYIF